MRCAIVAEICERLIKRTPSCGLLVRHSYWIESIFAAQLRVEARINRSLIMMRHSRTTLHRPTAEAIAGFEELPTHECAASGPAGQFDGRLADDVRGRH